ncbi:putative oxidoreductase YrbE [Porphyridium purpureum]|uniref:Putative oxidoreductase YrbE n=1 Tax=Porphyridium purpureum TaxID=35688 RepID=A0A5J4YNW9_PORPP|nr:putative oxidoreductase YrbE [Porphyridium purpureum]|eukprot:POR6175..scf249_10
MRGTRRSRGAGTRRAARDAVMPVARGSTRPRTQALRMADAAAGSGVGIGVIGCGRIGQVHAKSVAAAKGATLVAVSDVFEEFGLKLANAYGVEYEKDWKKMVEDPRIQGVVIGSPTPFHAEQIMACAAAGKDIFCEKPISNDLAVIDECLAAVEKSKSRLMVGFQRRFDSNFLNIKKQIEAGAIGPVRMFQIVSRDPAPPPQEYLEKSGGIFLDMASHDFDMARFVTGAEIDEVYVCGTAFDPEAKGANDLDSLIMTLKMSDGSFGTIQNSRRCALGYDQRIEVFGRDGILTGNNKAPNTVTLSSATGVQAGLPYSFFMDRYLDAYAGAIDAFVEMVKTGAPPPCTGADGRAPIVAAKAASLSAKENRPVKLSEV